MRLQYPFGWRGISRHLRGRVRAINYLFAFVLAMGTTYAVLPHSAWSGRQSGTVRLRQFRKSRAMRRQAHLRPVRVSDDYPTG